MSVATDARWSKTLKAKYRKRDVAIYYAFLNGCRNHRVLGERFGVSAAVSGKVIRNAVETGIWHEAAKMVLADCQKLK